MHSFERLYYENSALWVPERYETLEVGRAQLAVRWLPPDIESALDVGCGNGILTNQLTDVKFVVGIDRSLAALRYVQRYRCQADAVHLPFSNETFDLIIAMEVLEHLTFPAFRQALAEMVRVARRYILVTVPYREDRDSGRVSCPACGCRFHPTYHMRSFNLADLEGLFSNSDSIQLVRVSGVFPVKVFSFSKLRNAIARNFHRREFDLPWYTVCPQCGYSAGESRSRGAAKSQGEQGGVLRKLSRVVWPKKATYRWWMALYRKWRH